MKGTSGRASTRVLLERASPMPAPVFGEETIANGKGGVKRAVRAVKGGFSKSATMSVQRGCVDSATRLQPGVGLNFWIGRCRTANSADLMLTAFISANAQDVSHVGDGEWMEISPYGDFLAPDGSYVQRFHKEQAEQVVATWNSLTGMAARIFKNMWHRLGRKTSIPVWDGHPDADSGRWPADKLLAEVSEVRAGAKALEGKVAWSTSNQARTAGPLYPSPKWWHMPPAGNPPAVYPELLESIGLVPSPNIKSVAAWTVNQAHDPFASPEAKPGGDTQITTMNQKKIALALGLPEGATEAEIDSALTALRTTANSGATLLATANASIATLTTDRDRLTTDLTTANTALAGAHSRVTTLTTENTTLLADKGALTTANAALVDGLLHLAEKSGLVTPSQRPDVLAKLTSANTAAAAITELKGKRPEMNVTPIVINGNRVDLSTANARTAAFQDAVKKRMADYKETHEVAFAACMADPSLKPLVDAMSPAKAA